MKRYLINILLFCMLVLLIAVAADYLISSGLKRTERGHFYTMNALMNDSINADVIIIGNSRAAGSYHPGIIDTILNVNSRNLGISGQPFGVSYLRWQLYRRNNRKPKLLIVNMDYCELEMVLNGFEREQYYPYIKDTLVKPYLDLYGFSWAEKHVPMFRYRGDYKLMSIGLSELLGIAHDKKGGFFKGYSNENNEWNGAKLEKVLSEENKVKNKCNPEVVKLLERVLIDAKCDGVKVVFVYAPIYKKLKENLDESQAMGVYHSLSEKYGVTILDFSKMDFYADTCFFMDANHVNEAGAERFSKELAYCLDSLGIVQK